MPPPNCHELPEMTEAFLAARLKTSKITDKSLI